MKKDTRRKSTSVFAGTLAAVLAATTMGTGTQIHAMTVDSSYKEGTYTASATGYGGPVQVTVTIGAQHTITALQAEGEKETPAYWEKARKLSDVIVEKNGTDGVDAVSGATYSSKAILQATEHALKKASINQEYDGGTGTQKDPYQIGSRESLQKLGERVAEGSQTADAYFVLTADIDLEGVAWTPIGDATHPVRGHFDGKNHVIKNLTMGKEEEPAANVYAGLFGCADAGSSFENITLENVSIHTKTSTTGYAGALVGALNSKGATKDTAAVVDHCKASGTITISTDGKPGMAGGLIGMSNPFAAITNCGSEVAVTLATGAGIGNAGGLVGMVSIKALVMNNYTNGPVTLQTTNTNANAGALVGMANGILYNNYTAGAVTGNRAAGIAGNAAAASYTAGCHYVQEPAFGTTSGKSDADTVKVCSKEEIQTPQFQETMEQGLGKSSRRVITQKVAEAAIADCTDFAALTARVKNRFYDWTQTEKGLVHATELFADSSIDAGIFAGGSGTEEDPYQIKTEEQLIAFADSLTAKQDYEGVFLALTDDITLTKEWTPVGAGEYAFQGTFDGRDYSIKGLRIGTDQAPYQDQTGDAARVYFGFFGVLEAKAVVKNLTIDADIHVIAPQSVYVGGVAGYLQGGMLDSVTVNGVVEGSTTHEKANQFVGGVAGSGLRAKIINTKTTADVRAEAVGGVAEAGGIIGLQNRGLIANCTTTGTITGTADRKAEGAPSLGGIAGVHAGTIENCYAGGSILADCYTGYVGALAGWATGIADTFQSYFSKDMTLVTDAKTENRVEIKPAAAIGWSVGPGVNDEGEPYTGSVSLDVRALEAEQNKDAAALLNDNLDHLKVNLSAGGRQNGHWSGSADLVDALRTWTPEICPTGETKHATYDPNTEKEIAALLPAVQEIWQDGIYYGRDKDKNCMVKVTIQDGKLQDIVVEKGENAYTEEIQKLIRQEITVDALEESAWKSALQRALEKAKLGDHSVYGTATDAIFAQGDGTKEHPWCIENEAQLIAFAAHVNEDEDYSGKYLKLTKDITLTSDWTPAGGAQANRFAGYLDGGNHTIRKIKTGSEEQPYTGIFAGLFANIEGGSVQNLYLKDVDITLQESGNKRIYAGALAAAMTQAKIDHVSVQGTIRIHSNSGACYAGGLLGQTIRGTVTNSSADVAIQAVSDAQWAYVGGLTAMNARCGILNSYAKGSILAKGPVNKVAAGGIAGFQSGVLYNDYADVNIQLQSSTGDCGGVAGRNTGIGMILNCYCAADTEKAVGTIVAGENDGKGVVEGTVSRTDLASAEFAAVLNQAMQDKEALDRVTALMQTNWQTGLPQEISWTKWTPMAEGNVGFEEQSAETPTPQPPTDPSERPQETKKVKSVSLSKKSFVYNHRVQRPDVVVKDTNGAQVSSAYYTITYANKKSRLPGTYTVKITFKGAYRSNRARTLTYQIKPAKVTGVRVRSNKDNKIVLQWKQAAGVTGYQIQYSTAPQFPAARSKTMSTAKMTKTWKKPSKTCYIRIRSFKVEKRQGKTTKIYSSWSSVKKI